MCGVRRMVELLKTSDTSTERDQEVAEALSALLNGNGNKKRVSVRRGCLLYCDSLMSFCITLQALETASTLGCVESCRPMCTARHTGGTTCHDRAILLWSSTIMPTTA